jgi:hypothetical protein
VNEQEILSLLTRHFKKNLPTGKQICTEAIKKQLAKNKDNASWVKSHFSELIESTQIRAYEIYQAKERYAASLAIREAFDKLLPDEPCKEDFFKLLGNNFWVLDRFFLSLTQGRRSRAGKAFEHIIKTLFDILGYPYTPQAIINGQPDFLLPSQEHFTTNAMDCIIFTVKRSLRERWKQIVTEGLRGHQFFLATIDEKKGQRELQEMLAARIYLVVPARIKNGNETYTGAPNVISFETFFAQHLDPAMVRWRNNGVIP